MPELIKPGSQLGLLTPEQHGFTALLLLKISKLPHSQLVRQVDIFKLCRSEQQEEGISQTKEEHQNKEVFPNQVSLEIRRFQPTMQKI